MTNGHVRRTASGVARRPPGWPVRRLIRVGAVLAALALAACGQSEKPPYNAAATAKTIADAVAAGLPSPKVSVLATLPHSVDAWTEGLEISDGLLYEGTGIVGRSELRELDPKSGQLVRAAKLPPGLYGEGITVVGSLIWQLTYQNGIALEWNRETLNAGGRVPWKGEGWGLCHNSDGELIASDGSNELRVIDPNGAAVEDTIRVRVRGQPLAGLNELDCGRDKVWANVFGTRWIVAISLGNGEVTAAVDAAELVPTELRGNPEKVLNGIAAIPGTDTFLLTGKQWPRMYRVRFGA
ncbi:MAG: glutaminyl-peptide cyclotransferase [Actinomycetota bacterium]|nr:glutaminyl-peptide cyclotransferase [Actinomycetota bacterium]